MTTLKIAKQIAALNHLKEVGFKGSVIIGATKEEMEYLQQHTTVKTFSGFTVEVLIVNGKFISAVQYNEKNNRTINAEQFEQCRAQLGM